MQRITLARVTLPTISKMTSAPTPTDRPVLLEIPGTPTAEITAFPDPIPSISQLDAEPRSLFTTQRPFNPANVAPFPTTSFSSSNRTPPSVILSLDDFELAGLRESEDYENENDYYDSDYDSDGHARTPRLRRRRRRQKRGGRPAPSRAFSHQFDQAPLVPAIPDMRFEQHLLKSVAAQVEQGRSKRHIFWTTIVRDQVIMPFFNGFAWKLAGLWWLWVRMRRHGSAGGRGFWRGVWAGAHVYLR
ncbi:hypothetical protein BC936DRAFT_143075 [Jimgerdemannia flammicorona]|uniref:Uncharacterized protein n=2 Tax=Jimgerdemannia flammicorona TaxID=994334 RepID=A0A432ZZG5_9FUNG|nr:hypothetical protein BC936DRAFT_143075 [Jimgerdemannia flammicorona]RUS24725.1 hypothetical protein BC938DRAFT_473171 [Jimgerdemannia flammicorona]